MFASVSVFRGCHMAPGLSVINAKVARTNKGSSLRMTASRIQAAASPDTSTVKILIQGRNMTITESIKEYAENKVQKVTHNYEGAIKEVDVKLSVRGKNGGNSTEAHHQRDQIAEVTVYTLRHGIIRVEDTESDLYAAIDLVTDKLKRKLGKVKEKAIQRNNWPGRGGTKGGEHIEDHLDAEDVEANLNTSGQAAVVPEIVREKILFLENKMSPDEAIEQLESVGHDFFLFVDAKDDVLKVVYRRKYHGYGIIIPQTQ